MKRTIIWVIIAIFVLSACSVPNGAEQSATTSCTTGSTQMASSTNSTTNTTSPTTTAPTTISTDPTTVTTAPTTVTTVPTTVSTAKPTTSTTQPTTGTKATTNTTQPTTSTTTNSTNLSWESYELFGISAQKINEDYKFTAIYTGAVIVFSPDRIAKSTVSIDPIKFNDYQDLINISFDSAKNLLGEPHFDDKASAFYVPSYITEDAYLIRLYPRNYDGLITYIQVVDLLQGKIVEQYTVE